MDVACSIIDRDIARLEESIRALKSRRNELSPVSRLPPEVLCIIFSFIEDRNISHRSPESWINFSRVSQQWRSLALSAPELWTNIPINYPRWTQEMLIRSKMAKLTIRVDFSMNFQALETVKSCLSQMKRLGEISITRASGSILEKLCQNLPKSAPQLHTLRINRHLPSDHLPATIHEDFLCDTERLQHVDLDCKISWESRLLTGLTRLTLHNSLQDDTTSSIIQFLHALQRMPALTNLDLEDSIPHDTGGLSTYPTVNLPCLRVLRISSGVGALTSALRHITFPSSAVLNVTCKETQSIQIDFSNFFSVLAAKFLSFLVIRRLNLQNFNGGIGLKFLVWTTAINQDVSPPSLTPAQLELVLTWPMSPPPHARPDYMNVFSAAFDAMNLSALTQLQISTLDLIDSKTWLKTFGKLPLLEQVHVQSYTAQSFLNALMYKTQAADQSKTAYYDVSFPKLRYIHLDDTDFTGINYIGSISVDMLMDCFMERYERNAEIQVLHLDDCYNISDEDVERLQEIVVDVIWDGVERISAYDSEEERDYHSVDDLDCEDNYPYGLGRNYWF